MAEPVTNSDPNSVFIDVADDQNDSILRRTLETINKTGLVTGPDQALVQNDATETLPQIVTKETKSNVKERCSECGWSTYDVGRMERHIRRAHRGENPFQCYMCEYSTYNKSVFEEHIRVHQGIKPFKCSFCDYASASKKNAKKHEAIHRPDNPLRCHICGFISRHPKALKNHFITAHKTLDKKTCVLCRHTFVNMQKLEAHVSNINTCKVKSCVFKVCSRAAFLSHMKEKHGQDHPARRSDMLFKCALCNWTSSVMPRILLHLIHHPNQVVDDAIDVSILKKLQILQ